VAERCGRRACGDDILTEREDDPQRASKRLRYDINRHHVGVSAWLDVTRDTPDSQTTLTEALSRAMTLSVDWFGVVVLAAWGAVAALAALRWFRFT